MKPEVPELDAHRFVSYVDNYARVPLLLEAFPTAANYDADMPALACLAQVLGQGNNSVLYQQLVKKQLALQAGCFSSLNELSGSFIFQVVPYPGKSLASMYALLNHALDSFEARGVTDDDIAKFKGGIEAQYINSLQSVAGKVSQLAAFQTFTGNPNMIGKLLKMYRSVTKEDVMRVYEKYIKLKHPVVLSVLTKGQENLAVAGNNYTIDKSHYTAPDYGYEGLKYVKAKDHFDRSKMPGNGPHPVVKVPSFWKKDLDKGIKVIGTTNSELPVVTISVQIPGGHLAEANHLDKAGLASFFTDMMSEDTKKRSAEDMSRELQKLGSSISIYSDNDNITFNVQSLRKNLDATLALLEERMLMPKFTEDAFKRIQRQTIESFKQIKSQPSAIADVVFAKLNYGGNNILGIDGAGTEETVKNFTLADVQSYYDHYMTTEGTNVVVVGDVSEDEILPKLAFLQQLPDKKTDIPVLPAAPAVEKTKIYLVDVPKAAQTEFRVGYVTGLKYDATGEFYKAGLMNYVLGGAFNSRLNLNLREDKGWTYGARSGFDGSKETGDFVFSSGIKAAATDSALSEIMKEIKNYEQAGITDDEMSFMKSSIGQRDALRYETGFQKAGFIGRILEYNLPGDYVEQQNTILKNISKEEIDALAKKWLNADKMNILVVGDKQRILPGLEKSGYEIVELDMDGNPVQKKSF
jgi:zinc protease